MKKRKIIKAVLLGIICFILAILLKNIKDSFAVGVLWFYLTNIILELGLGNE